eukprot:SAG31_NODE_2359_length_5873_cov_2.496363_4_plen_162_part_00
MSDSITFAGEAFAMMEETHPSIVEQMMAVASAYFKVDENGDMISLQTGKTWWLGTRKPAHTRTFNNGFQRHPSKSAAMLSPMYVASALAAGVAYTAILPEAILAIIGGDPSTTLAERYRKWVQIQYLPRMIKVAQVIEAHAAIVELPSKNVSARLLVTLML